MKYINKTYLASFIVSMWDAGIECKMQPEQSQIVVYTAEGGYQFIDVFDASDYQRLVDELISKHHERVTGDPSGAESTEESI